MKPFSSSIVILSMLLGLLCFKNIYAQNTVPKSFEKKINRAEYLIFKKKYEEAERLYEQALSEHISDGSAIKNYLELFPLAPNSYKRIEVLKRIAQQNNTKVIELVGPTLCELLINENDWSTLKRYVNLFQSSLPKDHFLQDQLKFYAQIQNPTYWQKIDIIPLDVAINESRDLIFPHLAFQEQQLIFVRSSPEHSGSIYSSIWDSCYGWTSPEMLDFPFNDMVGHEGFYVSVDSRYLFFSKCDQKPYREGHGGGCDIYFSYYQNEQWSIPKPIGPNVNTYYDEIHPMLSADLTTLYFASNRPGGYGGMDLYQSKFDNGIWGPAENLGPLVNSSGHEIAPFIFVDNQTLFFSSNGWPGYGGYDFFKVNINQTYDETPQNLGPNFNTIYDEKGITIALSGQKAYGSSNRQKSDFDGYNIYEFKGDMGLEAYQYIAGIVYDSIDYHPLNQSNILVEDRDYWPHSNKGDASYFLLKKKNQPLKVIFNYEGYEPTELRFYDETEEFNTGVHVPLISKVHAASLKDTITVSVPSYFFEDFQENFQEKWPEINRFLAEKKIQNILIQKVFYDDLGTAHEQEINHLEIVKIEEALCPAWIPNHKLLFMSDINMNAQEELEDQKYFYEMKIISL